LFFLKLFALVLDEPEHRPGAGDGIDVNRPGIAGGSNF